MKHYNLVKITNGYVLKEISDHIPIDPMTIKTIKDFRDFDKTKVVATTEENDSSLHRLRIEDCDAIFGLKEIRRPKVSEKYEDAKYGTLGELQGISEMVRLTIYNYLSGRMSHKEFLVFYQQYQTTLHEHNIIKINDFEEDEDKDDVYFNDNLDDEILSRELPLKTATEIVVAVNTLKDEYGDVEFFSVDK